MDPGKDGISSLKQNTSNTLGWMQSTSNFLNQLGINVAARDQFWRSRYFEKMLLRKIFDVEFNRDLDLESFQAM